MTYWLLISQSTALFPISSCLWSWKQRKDPASLYLLIQFIFIVIFSLFYHTYDIEEIDTPPSQQEIWTFLDSYQSTSIVITTLLYCLRIRSPMFYIITNLINILMLIFISFNLHIVVIYLQILIFCMTLIIKWRTVYRYALGFYYNTLFAIVFACISLWFYVEALRGTPESNTIHSLWHFTVFIAAGCGIILRYKLDSKLYPITNFTDTISCSL
jgi:hypothetical protein